MRTAPVSDQHAGARVVGLDGWTLEELDAVSFEPAARFAVLAFPAGRDPATSPAHEGTVIVPGTDYRSDRRDLIAHAAANPDGYLTGTGSVRVELWMTPNGWNEGFETTYDPMLTYFVDAAADLALLQAAVAAVEHHLAWTGFTLRTSRGPAGAMLSALDVVVTDVTAFITGQAEAYIP